MKISIELLLKLKKESMKVTHEKTKTAVINEPSEELVQKEKLAEIKNYRGKIDLDIDLDLLRDRKSK